ESGRPVALSRARLYRGGTPDSLRPAPQHKGHFPMRPIDADLPAEQAAPADEAALEERLSRPTPGVLDTLSRLDGDFLILGVAGKMGPTLAPRIQRGLHRP